MSKETKELLNDACNKGYMSDEDFAKFIKSVLISEHGYVMDTGSGANVNAVIAKCLAENIESHPKLWKLFMVA